MTSRAKKLERIISDAWGEADPITGASSAADWLESEMSADYGTMGLEEIREKAKELRAAADLIRLGYYAACHAIAGAPRAVHRATSSAAGHLTATKRKAKAAQWHAAAIAHARTLAAAGRKQHEISGIVAARVGKSPRTVRPLLQAAGVLKKREIR